MVSTIARIAGTTATKTERVPIIMSYDRIYIRTSQHPSGLLERRQAARMNLSEHFELTYNRLHALGNFVVLSAGKNFLFDELFLFEGASDAAAFYDSGFMKWESFPEQDDEGCGFQEVSLYRGGRRVATKSCEPTKRAGTDQGDDSVAKFEKAAEFVEHDEETHTEGGL